MSAGEQKKSGNCSIAAVSASLFTQTPVNMMETLRSEGGEGKKTSTSSAEFCVLVDWLVGSGRMSAHDVSFSPPGW